MTDTISAEHQARIIELLSQAEKLIDTIDSWTRTPPSSDSSSSTNPLSTAVNARGTILARSKPGKPIDGLVKFKRRIIAELNFLQVRSEAK